jgi:hypothetical protein
MKAPICVAISPSTIITDVSLSGAYNNYSLIFVTMKSFLSALIFFTCAVCAVVRYDLPSIRCPDSLIVSPDVGFGRVVTDPTFYTLFITYRL